MPRPIASRPVTKYVLAVWRRVANRYGIRSGFPKYHDSPLPHPVSSPLLTRKYGQNVIATDIRQSQHLMTKARKFLAIGDKAALGRARHVIQSP